MPKAPFYLTGHAGGKTFSVHAEGERVYLSRPGETKQEVDLVPPAGPPQDMPVPASPQGIVGPDEPSEEELPPGVSPLDEGLKQIDEFLRPQEGDDA
jgi:hypothetical protein